MPGYSLSATTCVVAGEAVAITLRPSGAIAADTISGDDGGVGGTFTPATLTIADSGAPQVVTYSNGTAGTYTITLASAGGLSIVPDSFTLHVVAAPSGEAYARRKRWCDQLRRRA